MNQPDSYSGQRALFAHIDSLGLARGAEPFFESTHATGSHLASMQAVASGEADLAAIDCVLWAHAAEFQRELRDSLCVIDQTRLAPGLPFITSGSRSADELALMQEALGEVIGRPSQSDYQPLRLSGFEILPPSAYDLS
jgi:ABC-type phosphate/phosphonate transport system substrate-binding protein